MIGSRTGAQAKHDLTTPLLSLDEARRYARVLADRHWPLAIGSAAGDRQNQEIEEDLLAQRRRAPLGPGSGLSAAEFVLFARQIARLLARRAVPDGTPNPSNDDLYHAFEMLLLLPPESSLRRALAEQQLAAQAGWPAPYRPFGQRRWEQTYDKVAAPRIRAAYRSLTAACIGYVDGASNDH